MGHTCLIHNPPSRRAVAGAGALWCCTHGGGGAHGGGAGHSAVPTGHGSGVVTSCHKICLGRLSPVSSSLPLPIGVGHTEVMCLVH